MPAKDTQTNKKGSGCMRRTFTGTTQAGGCFVCNGSDAMWFTKNAVALAAKHHDKTGHATWAENHIDIRYGEKND